MGSLKHPRYASAGTVEVGVVFAEDDVVEDVAEDVVEYVVDVVRPAAVVVVLKLDVVDVLDGEVVVVVVVVVAVAVELKT